MKDRSDRKKDTIFSGLDTTDHFLFNPTLHPYDDPESRLQEALAGGDKTPAIPLVMTGEAFLNHTMERLENNACFSVMAIKPDRSKGPEKTAVQKDGLNRGPAISKVIDAVCRDQDGFWGLLDEAFIGCVFPEKNEEASMTLSRTIQDNVLLAVNETVSIGVAVYPMIDFKREDVLDNARKALAHAAFFGPGSVVFFDAVSLNISGDDLYQNGDVPGAIEEFISALKIDPRNVNIHNSLGVCYGVMGETAAALHAFQKAIEIDPQEVMAHYNAGYIHRMLGNNGKAMICFQQAEAINNNVYEVLFQIGKLYLETGDYEQGKAYLEKAADIHPESGIVSFHLGECCESLDMTDQAITHFKSAVKKNPNDAGALSALGMLYGKNGRNPEIAVLFCEKSVELSPETGVFQFRLGKVYSHHRHFEKALSAFETAVALGYPADSEVEKARKRISNARSRKN